MTKPKSTRRRRGPMPAALKKRAADAGRQHEKRYPAPTVDVVEAEHGHGWTFESPFRSADEEDWWRLLGEAFGTRTKQVVEVFMGQVAGLIGTCWAPGADQPLPREGELQAALAIVAAMKPKNEAEAALAAQAFALHVVAMRTGQNIASVRGYIDPRQSLALANLVKAYAGVMDSLKRGRSRNSIRQTITVRKDVHVHNDLRSVHVHPGEGGSAAEQPDGVHENTRARPCIVEVCEGPAGAAKSGQALLCAPEVRGSVQGPGDARAQSVPIARRKVTGSPQG